MLEFLAITAAVITLVVLGGVCGYDLAMADAVRSHRLGTPLAHRGRHYRLEDVTDGFPASERPFRAPPTVRVIRREP